MTFSFFQDRKITGIQEGLEILKPSKGLSSFKFNRHFEFVEILKYQLPL